MSGVKGTFQAFLKNNSGTFSLLCGVIAGGLCGVFFEGAVPFLRPVGDIFMNLMFVIVVPLVFLSIASSSCKLAKGNNTGKTLGTAVAVFAFMSLAACILAYLGCLAFNPFSHTAPDAPVCVTAAQTSPWGKLISSALTVDDFPLLLSKSHILPMIIFAAAFGLSTAACGEKAGAIEKLIIQGNEVFLKIMSMVMKSAPVGLGCYFAGVIQDAGGQIVSGYARVLLLYIVLALVVFFGLFSVYVLVFRGLDGLDLYWRHIIPPSLTAFATSSSIVAIPGNMEAAKSMGVDADIAECCIPFGINIHKDGSSMGGVMKVVFLLMLQGSSINSLPGALTVIGAAFLSSIVIGAIPSGGGTGEVLICSLLGLDPSLAGLIIVIATIIDMPATVINSSSNVVAALITDKLVRSKR